MIITKKYTDYENDCFSKLTKITHEVFSKIKLVYSFSCENTKINSFEQCLNDTDKVVMKNGMKAMKGECPTCATKVFRILGKA